MQTAQLLICVSVLFYVTINSNNDYQSSTFNEALTADPVQSCVISLSPTVTGSSSVLIWPTEKPLTHDSVMTTLAAVILTDTLTWLCVLSTLNLSTISFINFDSGSSNSDTDTKYWLCEISQKQLCTSDMACAAVPT